MRIFSILLFLTFSLFLFNKTADARVLPQSTKSTKIVAAGKTSAGISVFPRLRADKKAIIINFANLQNAKAVSYVLTYSTAQQEEGAMGTLNLSGQSKATQELLFGTCSKNVCRYHTNTSNMKLEVSYTSTSGKKYIKRFRLKV